MTMIFGLVTVLSVLALGFVFGRIWEIRKQFRSRQRLAGDDLIRRWDAAHELVSARAGRS